MEDNELMGSEFGFIATTCPRRMFPAYLVLTIYPNLPSLYAQFQSTSEDLPPNSVVFCLNPSGALYFTPSKDLASDSRSRSPSPEHNVSDGEVEAVRARGQRRTTFKFQQEAKEAQIRSITETRMKSGATLAEAVRYVA